MFVPEALRRRELAYASRMVMRLLENRLPKTLLISVSTRFTLAKVLTKYTKTSYISHPEILTAYDEALNHHSFKGNLASPFEQIY